MGVLLGVRHWQQHIDHLRDSNDQQKFCEKALYIIISVKEPGGKMDAQRLREARRRARIQRLKQVRYLPIIWHNKIFNNSVHQVQTRNGRKMWFPQYLW